MKRIEASSGPRIELDGGYLIEMAQGLDGGWSVALTVFEAEHSLTRHRHAIATEVYVGLSGQGTVHVEDQVLRLRPGDLIRIYPGEAHHAVASGTGVTFWALTFPAYDPEDFQVVGPVL